MLGKETKVINIKNAKDSPDEVYIGREGHGKDGYFGNPILLHKECPECGEVHTAKGSTLQCYEKYLVNRLKTDEVFKKRVASLSGKTLVCFCKPNKCHGDILAKVADNIQLTVSMSEQKHGVSIEQLHHFKCCSCNLWWTIGDFQTLNKDKVICPHCGTEAEINEIEQD